MAAPGVASDTSAADQYTYVGVPSVTAINPQSGPITGGTQVTISGTGLTGATKVDFKDAAGDDVTVPIVAGSNTDNQLVVDSPNFGFADTVNITVTTIGGASATSSADQFSYATMPAVSSISPTSGFRNGGDTVTITGTDLADATAVDFGTVAAASFTVNSDGSITVASPAGSNGSVDVTVVTPAGTTPTSRPISSPTSNRRRSSPA